MTDYGIDTRTKPILVPITTLGAAVEDIFPFILKAPVLGEVRFARFVNGATLALDAANFRTISIKKATATAVTKAGGTLIATVSNAAAAYTADTPVAMTMSAAANRRFAVDDEVAVSAEVTGTGGAVTAPAFVEAYVVFGEYDYSTP